MDKAEKGVGNVPSSPSVCFLCEHSDFTAEDSKACKECCFFYGSKLVVKEGSYLQETRRTSNDIRDD